MNIQEELFKCNKPYQYVGGEYLSHNKDFDKAAVRFCFAFPDKYEIGISNLGLRILYERVNAVEEYMADRVYAPDTDFAKAFDGKTNLLYALESKRSVKDFDIIGFSLQYEMSYPSVLKMLEMGGIEPRRAARGAADPIILAGGPCTFNPLVMSEFIDAFQIGDGEDSTLEIARVLEKGGSREEKIKQISELEGVWCPAYPKNVRKRIAQLEFETAPKFYPIPFSTSVQDRAIVEIRRGCTRMCRFCQPGHVTLPVRERKAEDVIKIAQELVKNTGYDEYSLLSLSSNDYSNIKEVIKSLSVDFDKKRVSVSLPSQRVDGFDLELAKLTQSVRKSTVTLAPEAGSQRLRDVIKKNVNKEQILNAALSLYENGWSRFKFYFIAGLPTETLEDMDEMADLLEEIKYKARAIKKEKGLTYGLDIVCTLSIFVPKPFTPFQFAPQMGLDEISEHIRYLKEKTKRLKGVKINYHEKFVSQIEAVLTRGDATLCNYIEALWKKGCYLDAWDENFDKEVWAQTASECGISLSELACKAFSGQERLPWEFIDVGIDKDWFVKEYEAALAAPASLQPTCESECVNCGVCKNLKTRKILAEPFKAEVAVSSLKHVDPLNIFRYRLKVTKRGALKYFSHLDWQNTFYKAVNRSELPVRFSQGFNPTMKISMGIALALFMESDCELVDIELCEAVSTEKIREKLQKNLPEGCEIKEIKLIDRKSPSIDTAAHWAEYVIEPLGGTACNFETFMYNCNRVLSSEEIMLTKKNKKGLLKTENVKRSIKSSRFEGERLYIVLKTGQKSEIPTLRADEFIRLAGEKGTYSIRRTRFFDENCKEL